MARILIADDQPDVLEALRILLKGAGHQTDAVTSLAGIFNALEKKDYALLMMDLNYTRDTTSGQKGLEVIPKLQEIGIKGVFLPGSPMQDIVDFIHANVHPRAEAT